MDQKTCDECGQYPANIHLTQIVGQQTAVMNLCEHCARKKGIDITAAASAAAGDESVAPEKDAQCPRCLLKYSEFKKKGRLGCAGCYGAFAKEISELLLQVHGSCTHAGKRSMARAVESADIGRLRDELRRAIHSENFERAAELRDKIHGIQKAVQQGTVSYGSA